MTKRRFLMVCWMVLMVPSLLLAGSPLDDLSHQAGVAGDRGMPIAPDIQEIAPVAPAHAGSRVLLYIHNISQVYYTKLVSGEKVQEMSVGDTATYTFRSLATCGWSECYYDTPVSISLEACPKDSAQCPQGGRLLRLSLAYEGDMTPTTIILPDHFSHKQVLVSIVATTGKRGKEKSLPFNFILDIYPLQ